MTPSPGPDLTTRNLGKMNTPPMPIGDMAFHFVPSLSTLSQMDPLCASMDAATEKNRLFAEPIIQRDSPNQKTYASEFYDSRVNLQATSSVVRASSGRMDIIQSILARSESIVDVFAALQVQNQKTGTVEWKHPATQHQRHRH